MKVKLVVYVPIAAADRVRQAIGRAGAGQIGKYSLCSFSSRGQGRFLPLAGAKPAIGQVGQIEVVEEERIEVTCEEDLLTKVIKAMKDAHPYEEVAYDVYQLSNIDERD